MKRTRTRPGAGPEAFDELVEAHLGDVHRYLVYLTGDRALAEDLTADAFERAWKGRDRFDPRRAAPRSWLLTIARSCALDHLRAEKRRGARERLAALREPGRAAEDAAGLCDGYSASLEAGLGRLSAADREVIALRVLLELDAAEAARLLEITPTACTTRLPARLRAWQRKSRPMSTSDPIAPDRLEALLRGESGSDGRERRIGALVDELTVGEIAPSAELRERVRSLSVAAVSRLPRRAGRGACRRCAGRACASRLRSGSSRRSS